MFSKKDGRLTWAYWIPTFLFLSGWEVGARLIASPLFPPFSKVIAEFVYLAGEGILLKHLTLSLLRVVGGFVLGSLTGVVMGIILGCSNLAYKSLAPLFSILYPIPALGWLPLLMLWLGLSEALPVTLIFICSFFPLLYNTIAGIRSVNPKYIQTARVLGASPWLILHHVIIPLALPYIFTGLRLEAGMAWRTVVAAEMIAIPTGIGALLINAESLIRVDIIFVCLFILSLMSFGGERIFLWLEHKLTGAWK
ncbi:NitT/TauT family transport system permease protein [Thermanaeromonas toyohensis ToBE]|uniref:NitT/TauT family transport system permease protein n=1 Tax=Thermanaeromonas toyohensis ToBE TaxID=698762 RepID=A0A1W1W2R8_9FIRM|nr:ABC transporter permease [Thermanaeromonas toyohensis]SMB99691.1 NitT/TauT family transport system permease protein [Thermanaeromonas toyohensis ToBE]